MAQSLLRTLVSGTRQMLAAQLFIAVLAVALAGWTLAITNELIRERDRLRERVVQLEQEMAARGIVVAPGATVAQASSEGVYPPEIGVQPQADSGFNPGQIITDLFAPPPPLGALVLHVRSEADGETAQQLVADMLGEDGPVVTINVMAARDARPSGYAYYDGRQSRTATATVARFNDSARRAEIPAWSAQLRGLALPAQGEFTAERLDIVLPPLPAAPAP